MLRLVALSVVVGEHAFGQMLWEPLEQLEKFAYRGKLQPEQDMEVGSGFVHPTLCDPSVNQTAGYLDASSGLLSKTKYFFWLFDSKSDPANDPLIMWLSGGPGCSSQLAMLGENGPCSVKPSGDGTIINPHSWHNKANVMWVDQPAGVGFSTGLGTHDEAGVAASMYVFLQGFFHQFSRFQGNDFFIFGESYAGHYVPAIAHGIWQANKNLKHSAVRIPMKGIAIGNGLTNPEEQYKWYAEMGHTGGQDEGGHAPSVFNNGVYQAMQAAMPRCTDAIQQCHKASKFDVMTCIQASDTCNLITQIPYRATGKNPYDMRIPCEKGNLCYDFGMIETWLNTGSVQAELGVSKKWASCNYKVNMLFQLAGDWMQPFHGKIPELLHDGIEVLIYAGDTDYICNWLGNKAWTKTLDWDSAQDFNAAEDAEWQLEGQTVARLRSASHFHFMQVFEAGHMVPMDQPAVSLEMVNRFISGSLTENVKATLSV